MNISTAPNPEPGYRLLHPQEKVARGDEYFALFSWRPLGSDEQREVA